MLALFGYISPKFYNAPVGLRSRRCARFKMLELYIQHPHLCTYVYPFFFPSNAAPHCFAWTKFSSTVVLFCFLNIEILRKTELREYRESSYCLRAIQISTGSSRLRMNSETTLKRQCAGNNRQVVPFTWTEVCVIFGNVAHHRAYRYTAFRAGLILSYISKCDNECVRTCKTQKLLNDSLVILSKLIMQIFTKFRAPLTVHIALSLSLSLYFRLIITIIIAKIFLA